MPRIPVRTTPYHTLPRCTRHYKSKRDLILRALGKASFINGSQFVIAWISPKGEVDVYASELLQSVVTPKDGSASVLNRKELDREAIRVKGEMVKRWDDVRRLEEQGEALVMEEEGAEEVVDAEGEEDDDTVPAEGEEMDGDKTLVEDPDMLDLKFSINLPSSTKKQSPTTMMSTFSAAARSSTPQPQLHTLTLAPDAIDNYYSTRFAALQQATCKLVVKAWIKVIEPKKQMKYPYNKGEELKPVWWPEGVRHREPDHLSKTERLTLLVSIVRSPLITVSRLELSTAEAAAFISRPRQTILREVYLVAKEEEKRSKDGDLDTELIVHLPHIPVSPSTVSPEQNEKRPHAAMDLSLENKENVFLQSGSPHLLPYSTAPYPLHANGNGSKRSKHSHTSGTSSGRLTPLTTSTNYDATYAHPFTFAPQHITIPQSGPNAWRDGLASIHSPAHLSPYPTDSWMSTGASGSATAQGAPTASAPGSEYAHSPNPATADLTDPSQSQASSATARYHPSHLAPIITHQHQHQHHSHAHSQGAPSPLDSPGAYPQTATAAMQTSYFHPHARHHTHPPPTHTHTPVGHSYMQQQQIEYMQAQQHQQAQQQGYDYGSPYIADNWEGSFTAA